MAQRWLFQTLPPLVIREIVGYTAKLSTEDKGSLPNLNIHYAALQPLLHTCHAWRNIALAELLLQLNISVCNKISISFLAGEGIKQNIRYLSQSYTNYVKNVYLDVRFKDIADGSTLACMQASIPQVISFTSAQVVNLELRLTGEETSIDTESAQHIDEYLQYIDKLMPGIACVVLHIHSDWYYGKYTYSGGVGVLFRSLLSTRPKYAKSANSSPQLEYHAGMFIQELTSISCKWDKHYHSVARVLHANYKSLSRIQILFYCADGLDRIFIGEDGQPVIYSYLKVIMFSKCAEITIKHLPKFGQFAPFPSLEKLYMDIEYPFSDDLVFRGNSKTLTNVFIQTDVNTMNALDRYRVFARNKQNKLNVLTMCSTVYSMAFTETSTDKHLEFLSKAMPQIYELRIHDMFIAEALPGYLSVHSVNNNIQLLELQCYLKLPNILQLIHLLPTLQVFRCMLSDLGSNFSSENSIQIASIMHARFDLSKSCLKRWNIINDGYFPCNPIATSISIAANMCLQLDTILFSKQNIVPIAQLFRRIQSSKLYNCYKSRFTPALVESSISPIIYIKRHLVLSENTKLVSED